MGRPHHRRRPPPPGSPAAFVTTRLCADSAEALPPALVAVTRTLTRRATSAKVSTKVSPVAPAMSTQSPLSASQLSHW